MRDTPVRCAPVRYTPMRHTPIRYTPVRYTPVRYTPIRCTLVGCMPVRYVSIFESGFVVLDAEPGLVRMSVLATALSASAHGHSQEPARVLKCGLLLVGKFENSNKDPAPCDLYRYHHLSSSVPITAQLWPLSSNQPICSLTDQF
jgi:hypothetical protein